MAGRAERRAVRLDFARRVAEQAFPDLASRALGKRECELPDGGGVFWTP